MPQRARDVVLAVWAGSLLATVAACSSSTNASSSGTPVTTETGATAVVVTEGTGTAAPSHTGALVYDTNPADAPISGYEFKPAGIHPFDIAWQAQDLIAPIEKFGSARFVTDHLSGANAGTTSEDAEWSDTTAGLTLISVDIAHNKQGQVDLISCMVTGKPSSYASELFALCARAQYPGAQPERAAAWITAQVPLLEKDVSNKPGPYNTSQPQFGQATMYAAINTWQTGQVRMVFNITHNP